MHELKRAVAALIVASTAVMACACDAGVVGSTTAGDDDDGTRAATSHRRSLVVLIHGYGGDAGGMVGLERALVARGVEAERIVRFDYSGVTHERLERNAERLRDDLRARAPARIELVGHSLGGMVARTFVKTYCGEQAKRCDLGDGVRTTLGQVFTIASPNRGTGWWWLLAAPVRDQVAPGSSHLRWLNRGAQPTTWMFAATFDVVVFPWWNAHWSCASCRHHTVIFAEHNSILDSSSVQDRIAAQLAPQPR
ncbi:MAG: hypothetical protein KC503_03045 [Myxococcales bacterium]|nr:hypothetical protein [Myxococcales bacterium]